MKVGLYLWRRQLKKGAAAYNLRQRPGGAPWLCCGAPWLCLGAPPFGEMGKKFAKITEIAL